MAVILTSFNQSCEKIRNKANNYEFINSYGSFQDYEKDKYAVQAVYEMRTLINKYFGKNKSMFDLKENYSKLFENHNEKESFSHIEQLLNKSSSYSMRNKFHEIIEFILDETKTFNSDMKFTKL